LALFTHGFVWLFFFLLFVLTTRTSSGNPETGKFRSAGTSKKYRRTMCFGIASDGKIMKIRTYRVLDPGSTMHA
jgi:hypothetical protein